MNNLGVTHIILHSCSSAATYSLDKCISLRYEKERYTPYTTASGIFVCETPLADISKVKLYIDGYPVHYGPVDSYEFYSEGGISYVKFASRVFSMGLSQNQPKPGINSSVNLESLISNNLTIPYVYCEKDTEVANYIFVKENSSLWDAIVALGQKVTGNYPYIHGENTVRLTKYSDEVTDLSDFKALKTAFGTNLSNIISDYHMKDTEDAYSYNYTNDVASDYEIVRHKYINLDRQWLSSPSEGLMHKGYFSGKGIRYTFIQLYGCCRLDLRQNVTYSDIGTTAFGTKEVSRIRIDYNKKGFRTSLWFYDDDYSEV